MARSPLPASTSRAPWAWAAAGLALGIAAALLLFAPARWLTAPLERATGGRLVLADARGTVWQGSARLTVTGGPGSADAASLPSRVDWSLRPRWNGMAGSVSSACCTAAPIPVRLTPRWSGVRLAVGDSRSQWPMALLVGLGTPWNTFQFEGDLQLTTQGLSVESIQGRLAIEGQAELVAQRLSSRLSTLRPMGSYRITLHGGATPGLQLSTLEGSLQLTGSGQWVGSRMRFSGVATAAPEHEGALSNLLNIIGRRSGPRSIITIG